MKSNGAWYWKKKRRIENIHKKKRNGIRRKKNERDMTKIKLDCALHNYALNREVFD